MNTVSPSFNEYMAEVNRLVDKGDLTVEQGVILRCCYKARVNGAPVHVNYLMAATGLNWKEINYMLNGLVLRGAIKKVEKKWYWI